MATNRTITKTLKIAAVAMTLGLLAAPAMAEEVCNGHRMPPAQYQREPNVPYQTVLLSPAAMDKRYPPSGSLPNGVWGGFHTVHANPPTWRGTNFTIYIRDGLSASDHACIVTYEKSHLPPNMWFDAKIEGRATIDWWSHIRGSHIAR